MATHHENFRAWYADTLAKLYPHRDAGFPILMIAFPLLERYLRQRAQLSSEDKLTNAFFDELVNVYPELKDGATARQFWQVYRNGLLHEVTLSLQDRRKTQMPLGSVSQDIPGISITTNGGFSVHPVDFSKRVVDTIEADFAVFEGTAAAAQLPTVKQYGTGVQQTEPVILSTNVSPPSRRS